MISRVYKFLDEIIVEMNVRTFWIASHRFPPTPNAEGVSLLCNELQIA